MVRRLSLVAAVLALAVPVVLPSGASAAFNPCDHSDNTVVNVRAAYIDVRYVGQPYSEMIWVYQETNDLDGLQRGGSSLLNTHAEQCGLEAAQPDQLIW